MIPVVHLPPGDQWDQHMLDRMLLNQLYPHGMDCEFVEPWPDADGIVLVIPGRYWCDRADEITAAIADYRWVLAIRTSDEEALLDITEIEHPNLRWWAQTPIGHHDFKARYLPLGFPPHFNQLPETVDKQVDVFLSAQNTHQRRREAFDAVARIDHSRVVEQTSGFTQGMPPEKYAACMAAAKVAPCPAGAVSPESFRVYEALEAHTVPIADDLSPAYDSRGYWAALFPDAPFPILTDYTDLPGWIDDLLADYPRNANRIAAWWMAQKRRMAGWLRDDLTELVAGTGFEPVTSPAGALSDTGYSARLPQPSQAELARSSQDIRSPITVLVSTSSIPSHPSTAIIEETIESVRVHLPGAEIVLMFDGVRPEYEGRRGDYEEYIRRALWLADHRWGNILPLIFDEHLHQAVCTKRALDYVRTPLVLFVEHDAPLFADRGIPWGDLADIIVAGDANLIRMHHEASVLEPHKHLMLDDEPQKIRGVPMMRTIQWSQRPHLASTAFYRELLDRWFPNDERNFVEEVMHSRLISAYQRDGDMGWMGWRTWMYTPDGNIQRSYHLDGCGGESTFLEVGC